MYLGRHRRRMAGVAALAVAAVLAVGCSSSSAPPSSGGGTRVKGGTATMPSSAPGVTLNWIFPFIRADQRQRVQLRAVPVAHVPAAVHVRQQRQLGRGQLPAVARERAGVLRRRQDRHDHHEGLEVVQRRDRRRQRRGLLAQHDEGREGQLLRLRRPACCRTTWPPTAPPGRTRSCCTSTRPSRASGSPTTSSPRSPRCRWPGTSPRLGAKPGSGGCATDTAADKWAKCNAVYNFLTAQAKNAEDLRDQPDLGAWWTARGSCRASAPRPATSPRSCRTRSTPAAPSRSSRRSRTTRTPTTRPSTPRSRPARSTSATSRRRTCRQSRQRQVLPATNPLGSGYNLQPVLPRTASSTTSINFNNPTIGPAFKQLYVRQALQEVIDQPGMDKAIYRGYAYPTSGGVPSQPPNQWLPSVQNGQRRAGPVPVQRRQAPPRC